jgi:hypothetical protein
VKIVSRFKDYYDGAMGYGIDKSLVYVRHTETKCEEIKRFHEIDDCSRSNHDSERRFIIIGFCGKLIPMIKTVTNIKERIYPHKKIKKIKFFQGNNCLNMYLNSKERQSSWSRERLENSFNSVMKQGLERLFVEHNVPIFAIEYCHEDQQYCKYDESIITLNPELTDYKFENIYQPYEAFQEIAMYMGGVLPKKDSSMVEVSEACKVQMKGFDSWSFRKKGTKSADKAKTGKNGKCNR